MLRIISYLALVYLLLFFYGCNSCTSQYKQKGEDVITTLNMDSINVIDSVEVVFYVLPSPEDIITYITDNDVEFNHKLLHDRDNVKNYITYEKKALALGTYFADLAYVSLFKKYDYLPEYLSTVDYLMKELNINPSFAKEQERRLLNASFSPDSLYSISRGLYDEVVSYLQMIDEGKTLSLLSVGTIVESLYLTTYLKNDFEAQKDLIKRVAEQQLLFEDLITMVETYKNNEVINRLVHDMKVLQTSFKNLSLSKSETQVSKDQDGMLVLKGSNELNSSEENYFIFIDNVVDFRTRVLMGE